MITVILHSPEHPGNVGAIARAMANFGFEKLVLITPQCDHLCSEARNRAKHAQAVLENAVVGDETVLQTFDIVVATSGKLGDANNIPRLPLTPQQLNESLKNRSGSTGLLFGRESCGLTNEELAKADFLVTIPTGEGYPILNLSHAVAIILSSLTPSKEAFALIKARQKQELYALVDDVLEKMEFTTPDKRETQRLLWHRLIGSSFLTAREAQAMLGFFKKLKKL